MSHHHHGAFVIYCSLGDLGDQAIYTLLMAVAQELTYCCISTHVRKVYEPASLAQAQPLQVFDTPITLFTTLYASPLVTNRVVCDYGRQSTG